MGPSHINTVDEKLKDPKCGILGARFHSLSTMKLLKNCTKIVKVKDMDYYRSRTITTAIKNVQQLLYLFF